MPILLIPTYISRSFFFVKKGEETEQKFAAKKEEELLLLWAMCTKSLIRIAWNINESFSRRDGKKSSKKSEFYISTTCGCCCHRIFFFLFLQNSSRFRPVVEKFFWMWWRGGRFANFFATFYVLPPARSLAIVVSDVAALEFLERKWVTSCRAWLK